MHRMVVGRVLLVFVAGLGLGACDRHSSYSAKKTEDAPKCRAKTLLDQQIVVDADSWQSHPFLVKDENCTVSVLVTGVRDTGKGFTVHVLPAREVENYQAHRSFRNIPTLGGRDVTALDVSEDLPAGGYSILIANTNNIIDSMIVNVTITAAPR